MSFERASRQRISVGSSAPSATDGRAGGVHEPGPATGVASLHQAAGRIPPVSAIVTTCNEADNIVACIESLAWCDEILVVDSYSSDRTVALARRFPRVRVEQRCYFGAASQKNWAMDRVANDWILILDADERVTPELRAEIEQVLSSAAPAGAYAIKRQTVVLGRRIRFSGWQHDRVVRLFRRGAARYPNRRVHADMLTREPAPVLDNPLVHRMVEDFGEYAQRVGKYAVWGAAQLWRDRRRSGVLRIMMRSAWRFLRTFILQGGFLDGMFGLVLCLLQAYGTFLKWATLWSWHKDAKRGRSPALPDFDDDPQTWAWPEEPVSAQTRGVRRTA